MRWPVPGLVGRGYRPSQAARAAHRGLALRLPPAVEHMAERIDRQIGDDPPHRIIVSRIRNQTVGLMVDAVSDILAVPEADIQLPPDLMSFHESALVKSLMIVEDRMLRVLDLEAVLPDHLRGAA